MPNGLFNWTFSDVVNILKDNGFKLDHIKGSHFIYLGTREGRVWYVCVPKHANQSLKPRTMKGIVLQSGLPKKVWGL